MGRISTLANPIDSAIDREITSKYDTIQTVAKVSKEIGDIGKEGVIPAIVKLAGDTNGELGKVIEGAKLINSLEVGAHSTAPSAGATLKLEGSKLEIGVPKGNTGPAGEDGMTPLVELNYNETTGELHFNVVKYVSGDKLEAEEM